MDIKEIIVPCIFLIFMLLFVIWIFYVDVDGGNTFCSRQGYDSVTIGGAYSEKFGKVKCVSCYDEECIYQEFNVTKIFGIIKEVKG